MAIWNLEGGKWKSEAGAEGPPPNLPQKNAEGKEWAEGDRFDDAAAQPTALTSDQAISLTGGFAAPAPAPARGDVKDHGRQGGVALTSDKDIFRTGGVALTSDKAIFRSGG